MHSAVLATWLYQSKTNNNCPDIIPDGCRDILFLAVPGQRPSWRLTSLDYSPHRPHIAAGALLKGFRLCPGTLVESDKLLTSLSDQDCNSSDIQERIEHFCTVFPATKEALICIGAPETKNIRHAATQLGISMRTLQRQVCGTTGRTPAGWLSLARARRAARLVATQSLIETAYDCGFSDQAHLSREFKRWFNANPSKLAPDGEIARQLEQPGYY